MSAVSSTSTPSASDTSAPTASKDHEDQFSALAGKSDEGSAPAAETTNDTPE